MLFITVYSVMFWVEYIGDYRRAAIAYENAIVLDPYNSSLYSALGMARYRFARI